MFRARSMSFAVLLLTGSAGILAVMAQTKGPAKPKTVQRAQPPKLEPTGSGTFFANALKDGLVGERPADLSKSTAVANNTPAGPSNPGNAGGPSGNSSGTGWSSFISSTSIEDEIKSLKKAVDGNVTTPSDFAGKGYKLARRDFSMLAMMFAIIGDYDGEVRFKADAPGARDVFARTAANSKVGTVQVFNEAKLRKQELADLINSNSPFKGKDTEKKPVWNQVCDRSPLMQHLEAIFEPRLKQNLSSPAAFKQNMDDIVRDAEVIAVIGQVIAQDGMEDADASEYKDFCKKMIKASQDITTAVKLKNFDAASAAASAIGKSCTECHEGYRSS